MPLSPPASRTLIHERVVRCQGFQRDDGLWDIEGAMSDCKTSDYHEGDHGVIPVGTPLHAMRLRITIDTAAHIHAAEAEITHTPFSICPGIAPVVSGLVGLTIGRGFLAEARQVMGGVKGCTHLFELLGPIATTAFQTLHDARKAAADARAAAGETPHKPSIIDTCHALRADGPVVAARWPAFSRPPEASD